MTPSGATATGIGDPNGRGAGNIMLPGGMPSPPSRTGPLPAGVGDPIGKRAGIAGVFAATGVELPCMSGPVTGCSALTRCTGDHELAMTSRLAGTGWVIGTDWSITGRAPGDGDGVVAYCIMAWAWSAAGYATGIAGVPWLASKPLLDRKWPLCGGVWGMENESWSAGLE